MGGFLLRHQSHLYNTKTEMHMIAHEHDKGVKVFEKAEEQATLRTPPTQHETPKEKETPLFGFDVFSLPLNLSPESRAS